MTDDNATDDDDGMNTGDASGVDEDRAGGTGGGQGGGDNASHAERNDGRGG